MKIELANMEIHVVIHCETKGIKNNLDSKINRNGAKLFRNEEHEEIAYEGTYAHYSILIFSYSKFVLGEVSTKPM